MLEIRANLEGGSLLWAWLSLGLGVEAGGPLGTSVFCRALLQKNQKK